LKYSIVHFQPVELYPPVMNWLNYLKDKEINVRVLTMRRKGVATFKVPGDEIRFKRFGILSSQFSFFRYLHYFAFYISATFDLIINRPETVTYYETLSALPVVIYKRIFNRNCRIMVHYHEYTSPDEYRHGMKLNRWGHQLEKKIYTQCSWISQTNSDRLKYFMRDNNLKASPSLEIFPNYPPNNWQAKQSKRRTPGVFRFVYVGALSLNEMFTKEFAGWVIEQAGCAIWDIYSANVTEETKKYLMCLDRRLIRFRGSADYFSLPEILKNYDAGVILYKGHIPNYIYNAPNKLFEYWACGLDVWFPENMKGSLPYVTKDSFPKIISIDFEQLNLVNLESKADRSGFSSKPSTFYCENVFDYVMQKALNADLKKSPGIDLPI